MELNSWAVFLLWIYSYWAWIAVIIATLVSCYIITRAFFARCAKQDDPAPT